MLKSVPKLLIAIVLITLLIVLWGMLRSPMLAYDDAFITYRYADRLRSGYGFTYNDGESVLGITTPFYGLLLALIAPTHALLPIVSHWIGVIAWIACALGAIGWGVVHQRPFDGWFAALFLAVQPSLYFSLGMETPLLTALLIGTFLLWEWNKRPLLLPISSAVLLLTRYDSGLWLLLNGLQQWHNKNRFPWREGVMTLICFTPWLLFAYYSYGNILPNSAAAKIGQTHAFYTGELASFSHTLWRTWQSDLPWWAFGVVVAVTVIGVIESFRQRQGHLFLWIVSYTLLYTVMQVASFPWYFVPIIAVANLLTGLGFGRLWRIHRGLTLVLLMLILPFYARSMQKATTQATTNPSYPEVGAWLADHIKPTDKVALIEIGVIGYHSQRPIVDTMGLVSPDMTDHQIGWGENLVYALDHYRPEYAVVLPQTAWDPVRTTWWFKYQYKEVATYENSSIYQRIEQPPLTYQTQQLARWGAGLTVNNVATHGNQIYPDQSFVHWLSLSVTAPITQELTLATILYDTARQTPLATAKESPYSALFRPIFWQPGDQLTLPVQMQLPSELPRGAYRLGIYWYEAETGYYLPLTEGELLHGWWRTSHPPDFPPPLPNAADHLDHPLHWQNGITLERFYAPATSSADEIWPIILQWTTIQPIANSYQLFFHLIDENGQIIAQYDAVPLQGRWPTTVWEQGETIQERIDLVIPPQLPSKSYTVRLGWYDSIKQQPTQDSTDFYLFPDVLELQPYP